jgi:hypothetical protein
MAVPVDRALDEPESTVIPTLGAAITRPPVT